MSRQDIPPSSAPYANHGRTRAAWILVAGVIVGFGVGVIGLTTAHQWLVYAGIGIVGIAVGAGWALRALGHGQPVPPSRDIRVDGT